MDDLTFVVQKLMADGKDRWPAVSEKTGVPVDTIIKVARGHTKNPRYQTLAPLIKHYRPERRAS